MGREARTENKPKFLFKKLRGAKSKEHKAPKTLI